LPVIGRSMNVGPKSTPEGSVDVQEVQLGVSVTLAGFEFPKPIVQFGSAVPAGVIGSQLLSAFALTYDLTNGRARL
jgi:hypothetical protein